MESVPTNGYWFDGFDDLYCMDTKTLNVKGKKDDNDDLDISASPDDGEHWVIVSYISRQFDTESYEGDNDSMEYTFWPAQGYVIDPQESENDLLVTMKIEFTYTELFNNWVFDTSALSSLFENMGKSIRTTKPSPATEG